MAFRAKYYAALKSKLLAWHEQCPEDNLGKADSMGWLASCRFVCLLDSVDGPAWAHGAHGCVVLHVMTGRVGHRRAADTFQ